MFLDQQKPIYELPQSKKRALIPKIIILILLSVIFYVGILLNVALLELRASQETITKTVSLAFVILVIIIGIILTIYHAKTPYRFFRNYLQINKENVKYTEILNTEPKQDFLDKIFKTYSINLGSHNHLRHIPQEIKIQDYLQQLIAYNNKQQ